MDVEGAGIIVGALGLLLSMSVFVRQIARDRRQDEIAKEQQRLDEEQNALERRLAQIEEERRADEVRARDAANIVPRLVKSRNRVGLRLRLRNSSLAEAEDIGVELVGKLGGAQDITLEIHEMTPIERLVPGQEIELHVANRFKNLSGPYSLRISWRDGGGLREKTHSPHPELVD